MTKLKYLMSEKLDDEYPNNDIFNQLRLYKEMLKPVREWLESWKLEYQKKNNTTPRNLKIQMLNELLKDID